MPSPFFPPTRTVDKSDGKGDRPSQAKGAILSGQLRDLRLTSTSLLRFCASMILTRISQAPS